MPIHVNSMPLHEPFVIESVGNHWNQEQISRPFGYPFYHYLQTEAGCGQIQVQGKKYILKEGEGVLLAPSIRHSYEKLTDYWTTSFFTITGRIESSIADMLENRQVIFREKSQGLRIQLIIDDMVSKLEKLPVDGKSLSVDSYRLLMEFVDGVYTKELKGDVLYRQYVAPAIQEIETSYDKKLTVEALSRLVYITPQYLSRLFRRFLNCSTREYLIHYRLSRAKELLLTHPGMEVQEIAHRVGFEEPSHFIAMFKKATGITPLEFRSRRR